MRILYHHRTGSKDGQAVHIEGLTTALRERGHQLCLVAPGSSEATGFGGESRLIAALKARLPPWLYELLELSYSGLAFVRLLRAYRRFRPEVLYERYSLFLLAGVWLKRWHKLPFLLEVNAPLLAERSRFGGLALRRLAAWSERTAWRAADLVLPVSDVLADHVRAAGVPEQRIVVIHNGVDRSLLNAPTGVDRLRRQLGLEGRIVLGFAGFVRSWHRLDRVIDLLAEDEAGKGETGEGGGRRPLHFLIIGDGPAVAELRDYAAHMGVARQVTFAGLIAREQIADHLAVFDLALQPDVVPYASPLKIFEYMALGLAIVAPDSANVREILVDGKTARLFDPDQPDAFQSAIRQLCDDPALRQRLAAGAAAALRQADLTWDHNARRVVALAQALVAQSPVESAGAGPAPTAR